MIIILVIISYIYRRYKKKKNSINVEKLKCSRNIRNIVENFDTSNDKRSLNKLK